LDPAPTENGVKSQKIPSEMINKKQEKIYQIHAVRIIKPASVRNATVTISFYL